MVRPLSLRPLFLWHASFEWRFLSKCLYLLNAYIFHIIRAAGVCHIVAMGGAQAQTLIEPSDQLP